MAFFPRAFHHPAVPSTPTEASFTPLFRLLDDFDSYSRQTGRGCNVRHALPQWQPKFDIRETAEGYELHGEFPGVSKENVHIEFTDPQTMLIRGKSERAYTAGTPPTGQLEDAAKSSVATEGEEHKNPHQATVEDQDEASERESGFEVVAKEEEKKKTEETTQQKPVDKAKYWLTERSIGEFARSFHFPSRVEQDAVATSFRDGILSITVPKAKKHEPRRIDIN